MSAQTIDTWVGRPPNGSTGHGRTVCACGHRYAVKHRGTWVAAFWDCGAA